jgi:hypothetical protein
MRPLTTEQIAALVLSILGSGDNLRDALLTDFLVAAYPTRVTQLN